jgi:hypothetical protein
MVASELDTRSLTDCSCVLARPRAARADLQLEAPLRGSTASKAKVQSERLVDIEHDRVGDTAESVAHSLDGD